MDRPLGRRGAVGNASNERWAQDLTRRARPPPPQALLTVATRSPQGPPSLGTRGPTGAVDRITAAACGVVSAWPGRRVPPAVRGPRLHACVGAEPGARLIQAQEAEEAACVVDDREPPNPAASHPVPRRVEVGVRAHESPCQPARLGRGRVGESRRAVRAFDDRPQLTAFLRRPGPERGRRAAWRVVVPGGPDRAV